ncbi:copper resistance protein CopC [Streptomyces liangshanensis]|uniref:Protein YobA n=1 Tax=Streptomyces liangshanensis TaxID=2717324 RepID=A0A6G9H073_9ACTN|nr:copper resistance protein CopC [Streptomyces liangshanensis]QIQ03874.1 copper resistance protein CopC/CopD [Streptomyces liangshanensis]
MTTTAPRFGAAPAAPLVRLLLVATVLLGTVFTVLSGTASAHAALTGSTPEDGAVVATAPKDVALTFSEQVALSDNSIRVLDPSNKRVDTQKIRNLSRGSTVTYAVDLHAGLPDGTYTVAWQAVSADSHPVSGAFTFSIGAPSKTEATLPTEKVGGGLVGFLYDVARYVSYAGFILLVGGSAFVLGSWPRGASVRPLQRLVVQGWIALTAATLVLLLLRTPYTGSGKLADAFDLGGLRDVLTTKAGTALVSRLLLLGAAALFVAVLFGAYARRGTPATEEEAKEKKDLTFGLAVGGVVVAAGIAATWALSEHASTGIQTGLAMPVDVLHLLAVAIWLGGLTALLVALYRGPSIAGAAVRRFSRTAFVSVVVLASTGLYQSWRQVGSWSALGGTSYGQLLLVKVGLVAVMVAIAFFSRRWTARLGEPAEVPAEAGTESGADAGTGVGAEVGAKPGAGTGAETDARADVEVDAKAAAGNGSGAAVLAGAEAAGRTGAESESGSETTTGQGTRSETVTASTPAVGDTHRIAQLARQQAAMATARQKRLRDADTERSGLRRSVLAEAGVAVVLLAVTTVLTSTEPGRTAEEEANRTGASASAPATAGPLDVTLPFDTGGVKGKGTVQVTLDPGTSGANLMHLYIDGPDGQPLDVPEVKVAFTLTSQKIGPLPIVPERFAAGHWSADGVQLPMPGVWKLQVTVRTSDIDQITVDKNVKIG